MISAKSLDEMEQDELAGISGESVADESAQSGKQKSKFSKCKLTIPVASIFSLK